MNATAVILLLVSAVTHAGWNLLSKREHPSAAFFLVGPDGGGLVQYAHGITAEEIAADIQQFIPN